MFGGEKLRLDADAVEVAKAWSVLEEPQRSMFRRVLIQGS
jgi:hypothetical protein